MSRLSTPRTVVIVGQRFERKRPHAEEPRAVRVDTRITARRNGEREKAAKDRRTARRIRTCGGKAGNRKRDGNSLVVAENLAGDLAVEHLGVVRQRAVVVAAGERLRLQQRHFVPSAPSDGRRGRLGRRGRPF